MDNNIDSSDLRSYLHMKSFQYPVAKYPFKELLESLYGCELSDLHKYIGGFDKFDRQHDQSTLIHKVFYSNFKEKIKPIYENFIKEFIPKIVLYKPFYYQIIPTLRVGLPKNVFVGEFHKDSFYNHQKYELNFNLGLANYEGDASLVTEIIPNSKDWVKLSCPYGNIFSFDHIDCLHGSKINNSNKTMVSFDFRLALKEIYFSSESKSVNMKSLFKPGEYFSKEVI
nr:hypothetical protein [Prochlorococcus marinus]